MNRFLIFGGQDHYAHGGCADLIGSADTLEQSVSVIYSVDFCRSKTEKLQWVHVLDTKTGDISFQSGMRSCGFSYSETPDTEISKKVLGHEGSYCEIQIKHPLT